MSRPKAFYSFVYFFKTVSCNRGWTPGLELRSSSLWGKHFDLWVSRPGTAVRWCLWAVPCPPCPPCLFGCRASGLCTLPLKGSHTGTVRITPCWPPWSSPQQPATRRITLRAISSFVSLSCCPAVCGVFSSRFLQVSSGGQSRVMTVTYSSVILWSLSDHMLSFLALNITLCLWNANYCHVTICSNV